MSCGPAEGKTQRCEELPWLPQQQVQGDSGELKTLNRNNPLPLSLELAGNRGK